MEKSIKAYDIAVIKGDGIGPDVVDEGIKVINKLSELDGTFKLNYTFYPYGCEYYLKTGKMMDDNGMELLDKSDAIILGAIGYPTVPDHISLRDLLIKIRREFDEYVNYRPIKLLKGAPCPLKGKTEKDIDFIVIRENSEGEYAGLGSFENVGTDDEYALQTGKFTKKGVERIIRYAFELARKEKRHKVTSVTKGNALNYSMVYWNKKFDEISKEYPDIEHDQLMVDAASMFFVTKPERFDIVVTSNLFGDILTDLGAAITGGMGIAAGLNINPEKTHPSMYESIHGSAPDIAGLGIANPIAEIWACAGVFKDFGYDELYNLVIDAIEVILSEKKVLTPDLGGTSKTSDVGDEMVKIVERLYKERFLL